MRFLYFIVFVLTVSLSCQKKKVNPNTFKYNLALGLSTLDPAFSRELTSMWACSHIYESLFILDSNAELQPLLIQNYTINSDSKSYTFHLKNDIKFHKNKCFPTRDSSRYLLAQDVVYSLGRLINPETASPGSWVLNGKLDSTTPFEIIDSFTFKINLSEPNAQFLQVLSLPYCSVIPHEAVEFYGKEFRRHPVGTGPFQFKFWDEGEVLFLEKNKTYHQKDDQGVRLPYLDMIQISFDENKKTEVIGFQKKKLSFITGLDPALIQEVFDTTGNLNEKWKAIVHLSKKPFLNTEYIAILMDEEKLIANSPLKNILIRKAINHAIDRKAIVRYIKNNLVSPADKGFVPIGMPNYDTSFGGYDYRPDLSKSLISKAGYSSKNKPKITLHINNSMVEMAEYLVAQLRSVGFDAEIKLMPADMVTQLGTQGKIDFFRRSWMGDYPDAENYYACFYSKNSTPPNYTRFKHARFDQLYEEIRLESNSNLRKLKYKEMEQIIMEKAPIVPIFYDQSIRISQINIIGLNQNVLNTLDLRRVKIN